MLVSHSVEPNMVYNFRSKSEWDDGWHGTYATRTIHKGDRLTIDFNTIFWDREVSSPQTADDRAFCEGFAHLPASVQDELYHMSWLHVSPEQHQQEQNELMNNNKKKKKKKAAPIIPGEALSHYVRSCWDKSKKQNLLDEENALVLDIAKTTLGPEDSTSTSNSSSDEERTEGK
jgi:siderophore synthetase component